MANLQQLKGEFSNTNVADWSYFADPDVWANTNAEMTIRSIDTIENGTLTQSTVQDLESVYGQEEFGLVRVRVSQSGVPFYETDMIVVGIRDERRYFPHDVPSNGVPQSDFVEHIGRIMTEKHNYRNYDDVLDNIDNSATLG